MKSPFVHYVHRRGRSVFYGWWIVFSAAGLTMIGGAFYFFGFSTFLLPVEKDLMVDRGPLSLAVSVSTLEGALLGPIQGYFVDRYGPRRIMMLGVALMGLGFVLLSTADSLLEFYLYFIPFIGVGAGLGIMAPSFVAVSNWFIRKRGTAFGIAMTGVGVGGLLVPFTRYLIAEFGWQQAALIIGIIIWAIGMPLTMLMRHRPEQYGMLPDGLTAEQAKLAAEQPSIPGSTTLHQEINFTVGEALTSPAFWQLGVGFGLRNMLSSGILIHMIAAAVARGHSEAFGAGLLGIMAGMSIPSRILGGVLQDRVEKRKVGGTVGFLTALSLVFFLINDSVWALATFAVLFSIAWGAASPTQQAIRGEYFGRLHYAKINGFANLFMTSGSIAGPALAGFAFDATHTYQGSFTAFAVLSLVSAVVIWHAKRPVPNRLRNPKESPS